MPGVRPFQDLYFGMATGEKEAARRPEQFYATYTDRWNLINQVDKERKFLLLGPKGAGKSAAAEYLRIYWENLFGSSSTYFNRVDMDEAQTTRGVITALSERDISRDSAPLTDAAWRLFISCRVFESIMADPRSSFHNNPKALSLFRTLEAHGLTSRDFPQLLKSVRARRLSLTIPTIASGSAETETETSLSLVNLGSNVFDQCLLAVDPETLHVISFDGLDRAVGSSEGYWIAIASLIRVVDSLVTKVDRSNATGVRFLVMCRSDVFRRASFADSAKIAADSGVYLEWGAELEDPSESPLWPFLEAKAEIDEGSLLSMFPPQIAVHRRRIFTPKYILERTRHTPRDVTLLFKAIQNQAKPNQVGLSDDQVKRGIDRYSAHNFLPEVLSEAAGLLNDDVSRVLPDVLSGVKTRTFTRSDFHRASESAGVSGHADEILNYLYLQGAVGIDVPGSSYVHFYHRRDTVSLMDQDRFIFNYALVAAQNKKW